MEEVLPHIMTEFYFNSATEFQFIDALFDEDGKPYFPFGGTFCMQHFTGSDEWRVYIISPFPNKGHMILKHKKFGWLMPKLEAIRLARKMQP